MTTELNKRELDNLRDLQAAYDEPLDPELEAAQVPNETFGTMIAHKFYHTPLPAPNGWANRAFRSARDRAQNAWDSGRHETYVFTHERPYRFDALLECETFMDVNAFCMLAREVWIDSENIHQHVNEWLDLFERYAECANCFMTESELDYLDDRLASSLEAELTIYRGECNDGNISWTLSEKTAKWFANRQVNESTGEYTTGRVKACDVFAYFESRGEEEILVLDRDLVLDQQTRPA